MAETVRVKASQPHNNTVLMYEVDERHPDGAVFVVRDGRTYTVGRTERVVRALDTGLLIRDGGAVQESQESGTRESGQGDQIEQGEEEVDVQEQVDAYVKANTKAELAAELAKHGIDADGDDTKVDIAWKLFKAGKMPEVDTDADHS